MTREDLRAQLCDIVCRCGDIPPGRLRTDEALHRYGLDSLAAVNIAYELGLLIGRDVPSTLVSEADTVDKLVEYAFATGSLR
jgi:acyl carrier protein